MSSSEEESDQLADLEAIRDQMLNQPRVAPMQVSAWEDDDDGVEADRNAKEPDAQDILTAAENGNLKDVKMLLTKNPSLLESTDKDGYTPLHRACYGNHVQIVEYLLQAGAKIDAKTNDEWQPLHSACCWNNVECAAVLLENGADINAKNINPLLVNSSGDTAEQIAKRTGKYYPMFEIIEDCLNVI
ncbi:Ankyrin repeat domain-containing protein 49 [Anthophora quadrimaculata]